LLVGSIHQRIQAPVGSFVGIRRNERAIPFADGSPRWRHPRETDERPAVRFGQAALPALARPVAESVNARSMEANNPFSHGLRVAAQRSGDGVGPPAMPTVDDHARAPNPVGRGMAAGREATHGAFLGRIQRRPRSKELRHKRLRYST
jgi:hypothetical protein